jgi:hypothetical protein
MNILTELEVELLTKLHDCEILVNNMNDLLVKANGDKDSYDKSRYFVENDTDGIMSYTNLFVVKLISSKQFYDNFEKKVCCGNTVIVYDKRLENFIKVNSISFETLMKGFGAEIICKSYGNNMRCTNYGLLGYPYIMNNEFIECVNVLNREFFAFESEHGRYIKVNLDLKKESRYESNDDILDNIDISIRAYNVLKGLGITTVSQLLNTNLTLEDFRRTGRCGKVTVAEIENIFKSYNAEWKNKYRIPIIK